MDQRNLLLAIVLSVAILVAFQYLAAKLHLITPPSATAPTTATQTVPSTPAPAGVAPGAAAPVPAAGGTGTAPAPETRGAALAEQPRVRINTPRLHGSIALNGGRIDDLTLATYHDTVDPKSPEVVLLWPTGTADPYFAQFGWVAETEGVKVPGPDSLWTAAGGPLTPTAPVTLTWDNGAGLLFTRTISVDQNYMFTIRDAVKNSGNAPVSLSSYGLISRTGMPPLSGYAILHEGLIGYIGGYVLGGGFIDQDTYAKLAPGTPREYSSTGGWLGFTDKYWLTALVPPQDEAIKAEFRHTIDASKVDRYQADFTGVPVTVAANGTAATSIRFFAGAKEVDLLNEYRDSREFPNSTSRSIGGTSSS